MNIKISFIFGILQIIKVVTLELKKKKVRRQNYFLKVLLILFVGASSTNNIQSFIFLFFSDHLVSFNCRKS
jgi:hypothetical protein